MSTARQLYLTLMKRCICDTIYGKGELIPCAPKGFFKKIFINIIHYFGFEIARKYNRKKREEGRDWPFRAHSMAGLRRMDQLQRCVEDVIQNNVDGDLIETGTWRGGSAIFMRAILKAYEVDNRIIYVADSFQGLPVPNTDKYPLDKGLSLFEFDELAIPIDEVRNNFAAYGLLDDQVKFIKGWFKDTLPNIPVKKLAILRLDGDLYESTMDSLTNLYPKVTIGGYVLIDDYGAFSACKKAVEDFRKEHDINEVIESIDWAGVYWKRLQ